MRLILSKKTANINFTGRNIFFWQNWYFYHHCCSNFIQQYSVNRNSNYHFIYLPFGVNCKMFYIYVESFNISVESFKFFWFGRWYINQTPANIVIALKKLRVPIHNSVNRLWILDVSGIPRRFPITETLSLINVELVLVLYSPNLEALNYSKFPPTSDGFKFYPRKNFHSWWNFLDISVIVRLNLQNNFRTHYFLGYTIAKHSFPTRSLKISSLIGDYTPKLTLLKCCQNFGLLCLSFRIQWRALEFRAQCFEENTEIFLCANLKLSKLISCRKNSKA